MSVARKSSSPLRGLIVLLAIFFVAGCRANQSGLTPGHYVELLRSGGLDRSFIVSVPKSYQNKPIPVVLVLHGWLSTASEMEQLTRMSQEGEEQGFVSVYPDGMGKGWNAEFMDLSGSRPNDVKFIEDVLDWLEKNLIVDQGREYVCGHSNGAFMTNDLGARLSNRLAAIGSVAGTIGLKSKHITSPQSPISVILIHGKRDAMVSYSSDSSALLKGIGAEDAATWWATQDGCGPDKTVSENGNVKTELYSGGKGDTEVELVSIANGTHFWPGGWSTDSRGTFQESLTNVNATSLLWQFFKSHPKSGAIHQ